MENKVCFTCNSKKSFDKFCNGIRECKQCYNKRSLKLYYENKDKLSNQRNLYYEKKDVLIAKSKLNQQNRNYEKKI